MTLHYEDDLIRLHHGDALEVARTLEAGSVRTIVTSPPYYGLRDYGKDGQIGAESSVSEYVDRMVALFRELRRVLADDGTLWLNLGDSYAGNTGGPQGSSGQMADRGVAAAREIRRLKDDLPPKNLIGVPWRVAFALQADGWILRSDIIWAKPSTMPESVTDRPTKAHEYLFLFAKTSRYHYDAAAIAEPAVKGFSGAHFDKGKTAATQTGGLGSPRDESRDIRNKRTVWTVATTPFTGAHFAVYPPELIRPCILAGSSRGDTVLDPFSGSGTTGMVATQEGRRYIGIDLNAEYLDLSLRERFQNRVLDMTGDAA